MLIYTLQNIIKYLIIILAFSLIFKLFFYSYNIDDANKDSSINNLSRHLLNYKTALSTIESSYS